MFCQPFLLLHLAYKLSQITVNITPDFISIYLCFILILTLTHISTIFLVPITKVEVDKRVLKLFKVYFTCPKTLILE